MSRVMVSIILICFSVLVPITAFAQFRLVGNVGFDRFEQQVKTKIGGERGERLVEETYAGLHLAGTYRFVEFVSAGLYVRGDVGSRSAGRFESFDENGAPTITDETGGAFAELWVGPLVTGHLGPVFLEVGYGALGFRTDDARSDLPGADGNTDAFRTSPSVAWLVAIGAGLPIVDSLHANLRLEYRVRYYTRRGGEALADDVVHGTQNLTPFFGVIWEI